jgi:hypothetical protein
MLAGLGSVRAAEKIHWEDLQKRLSKPVEFRSVNVVTRDGQKYHSQRLELRADRVVLYNREALVSILRRQDVERVEIRERKRYYRHIPENVLGPFGLPILGALLPFLDPERSYRPGSVAARIGTAGVGIAGFALGTVLAPPLFAYGVGSAPVLLAADGVAFLMPAKAFEIVE